MTRVPSIDPERDRLIAHYEKRLRYFQGIPAHRREAECADEGEQSCRAMLAKLRGGTYPPHSPGGLAGGGGSGA